jgi:hypothetical protein
MSESERTLPTPTKHAVNSSAELERLWRPAQARGWRIDSNLLASYEARFQSLLDGSRRINGIDFTDDRQENEIHHWLSAYGITISDAEGRPSLTRKHLDAASVPESSEARAAWDQFRKARHAGAMRSKLREIGRHLDDGRVHSQIIVHKARTGRGSIIKPGLHNVAAELRPIVIAERGHVLVGMDLGQVEPRVAARLSGDATLKRHLAAGDVYAELAETIWGRQARGNNAMRRDAKTLFLRILYGAGTLSLATSLGVSRSAASDLKVRFWRSYPDLARYAEELKADMRTGRSRMTAAGRPVPVPLGEYQTLNHRVQAEATDLFYNGIKCVARELGPNALFLPIHDELIVQVREIDADTAMQVLASSLTTDEASVRITGAPVELGAFWRKAE